MVKYYFTRLGKKNEIEEVREDVQADYVSDQELVCISPSFEIYGPRKVEVVISINKADFTITKAYYTYYLNTKAEYTIAFGPGLLTENAVGQETMFVIQARNKENKNRESGADDFVVRIIRPDLIVEKGEEI